MAVPIAPALHAQDAKQRQLVVTKRRATALLCGVSAVFVAITVWGGRSQWAGYAQATAEASMVGGLADWFAVTALFRHPLGLPIPHTAIVVERKAQFAETLGSFIQESFLTPETIVSRLRAADPVARAAAWLLVPANDAGLAGHAAEAMASLADVVGDRDVHQAIEGLIRHRAEHVAVAPVAGRALAFLIRDGRHTEALDALIVGLERYLDEHRAELHHRLALQAPWWLPGAVEDRIFERLIAGAQKLLSEMAADPDHELRRELETRLARLANDLQTSPELRQRGEQLKAEVLSQPGVLDFVASVWDDAKAQLRAQGADPASDLRRRLASIIASAGARLRDDVDLAAKVQGGIESGARRSLRRRDRRARERDDRPLGRRGDGAAPRAAARA